MQGREDCAWLGRQEVVLGLLGLTESMSRRPHGPPVTYRSRPMGVQVPSRGTDRPTGYGWASPQGGGLPARCQGSLQVSGEAGLHKMRADLEGLAVGHLVGVESASPVPCPPKAGSRLSPGPPALKTESLICVAVMSGVVVSQTCVVRDRPPYCLCIGTRHFVTEGNSHLFWVSSVPIIPVGEQLEYAGRVLAM